MARSEAAEEGGWHVVSIKNDWKRVFSFEEKVDSGLGCVGERQH